MSLTTTIIDNGHVALGAIRTEEALLNFVAPGTVLAGTILARNSATQVLVPFVKGAGDDTGVPKAVLLYELVTTEAGDTPVQALVTGVVNRRRLVIAADGDGSNVDATVLDQLRDFGITHRDAQQLASPDNS